MAEITLTAADWAAMAYMNESQVAAYVYALGDGRYDGSDELVRVCFDISMANRMDVHEADERRLRDEEIRAESVIEKRREAGRKGGLAKARKMKQIVANVANVAKINLPENPSENVAKSFATNSDKSDSCEDGVVANVAKTFCYNSTRNNDESYCLLENSQSPSRACACGNDYNIASNNSISVIDNNIKHKPNNNSWKKRARVTPETVID